MSEDPINFVDALRKAWIDAGIIPETPLQPAQPSTPEEEKAAVAAYVATQRLARFKELCPPQFKRKIDRTKIPDLKAWDKADEWGGGHPGIWIWSHETGRAKSRMLWRKFGQIHCEQGRTVARITGQGLAEEYFKYHMEGNPSAFYEWALGYDVLMLDDLDKMDISDKRAPRMCRELFDKFYENEKPVLVTANESIEHFQKRIGESTARRMYEVCKEVEF